MKVVTIAEGAANWQRLQALIASAEEASPKVKMDRKRFATALEKRQARTFARIVSNPSSRQYRDYVASLEKFD